MIVAVLPAISPGPAILLALTNALRHGPYATVWSGSGNALGLFLLGLAVAFGVGQLMMASALAFIMIKVAGAAYLIFLGVSLWRKGLSVPGGYAGQKTVKRWHLFGQAFLIAITNPKAILILAALLPPFMQPGPDLLLQALALSAVYALLCLANHLCIAYFAGRIRLFLFNPKRLQVTEKAAGACFIGFGMALLAVSRSA